MATYSGADKAIDFLFKIAASIADDYDSSSTYAIGDYVIYSGTLYKCTTAIGTAEDFTPAHWQAVLVMGEISSGGGGGGTTVIANPAGQATDTLNKLQVGNTIYDVPSGGGSSGHSYSLTEQIVGTWIDGTTIYECTFDLGNDIYASYNSWTTLSLQLPNIYGIIYAAGINPTFDTFNPLLASYNGTKHIQIQSPRNTASPPIKYLILQYTKTA